MDSKDNELPIIGKIVSGWSISQGDIEIRFTDGSFLSISTDWCHECGGELTINTEDDNE